MNCNVLYVSIYLIIVNFHFYGMQQAPVKPRLSAVDRQESIKIPGVHTLDWGSPILPRRCSRDLCLSVEQMCIDTSGEDLDRSLSFDTPGRGDLDRSLSFDTPGRGDLGRSLSFDTPGRGDLGRRLSFDTSGRTDRSDSLSSFFDEDITVLSHSVSSNTSIVTLTNQQQQNDIRQRQIFKCFQSPSTYSLDDRIKYAASTLKHINRTQRQTKQKMAGVIVDKAVSEIRRHVGEEDYPDKAIVDLLENEDSKLGLAIKKVSCHLSSAKKRKISVVDINHIKQPKIDNKRGKEVLQGGHDLSAYAETAFLSADINAFVDRNGVIATMINGVHPKTALPKIIPSEIIDVSREGYMIAQSSAKKMKKCLLKNEEGMYFEGFLDQSKNFLYKTMYPVLTIDLDSIDDHGNIQIGGFGKIKSDRSGVDIVSSKNLSKTQLEECIVQGIPFGLGDSKEKYQSEYDVTDITEPLSKHCATELLQMSTEKMPGTVYTITRKMSGVADHPTDGAAEVSA